MWFGMGASSVWAILTLESHMANQHYYIGKAKFYVKIDAKFLMKRYVKRQWGNEERRRAQKSSLKSMVRCVLKNSGLTMQRGGYTELFYAEHHKFRSYRCQAVNLKGGWWKTIGNEGIWVDNTHPSKGIQIFIIFNCESVLS